MRKFIPLGFFALAVVLLSSLNTEVVSAFPWNGQNVSGPYDWPPYFGPMGPGNALKGYSFSIVDDYTHGGEDISRLYPNSLQSQETALIYCEGFSDPTCASNQTSPTLWSFVRVLPPCENDNSPEACIEALEVNSQTGESRRLVLDHTLDVPLQWDASIGRSIGRGSAPSLWRDPADSDSSDGYLVSVSGNGICSSNNPCTEIQDFSASVSAYKTVLGSFGGKTVFTTPGGHKAITGSAPPVCIWHEKGKCGLVSNFENISTLKLSIHLPKIISGWYMGRFADPNISIDSFSPNYYRLTLEAKPVEIPMVAAKVELADATSETKQLFSTYLCDRLGGYCGGGLQSNDVSLTKYFEVFSTELKDTAQLMMPKWSFRSIKSQLPCTSSDSVSGLVSTNSTLYDGAPPVFADGNLNYHVGALHFRPDGTEFKGSYNLLMSSSFARCLYKFSNAPVGAKVAVISSKGLESIATTSLTENSGWLHLSVNGFTFSNPTISVKLNQESVAPPANPPAPTSSPTPTQVISSKQNVAAKKLTILCVKGKSTKKVFAIKPVCPSGYKKKIS